MIQLGAGLVLVSWLLISWRMAYEVEAVGNGRLSVLLILASLFFGAAFTAVFWSVIAGIAVLVALAFGLMP